MNENEKQAIEEMARIIGAAIEFDELDFGMDEKTEIIAEKAAKAFYNDGYRKQSDGEWENVYDHDTPDGHLQRKTACSVCGYKPKGDISAKTPYCPNCGTRLKGGAE